MSKSLNTNFHVKAPYPIDSRMKVDTYADLDAIPVKYNHMVTHVEDTDKDWKYYSATNTWTEVTIPTPGTATWGDIVGDITNQADLMAYFDLYALVGHTHPASPPAAHDHVEADITDLDKYTQAEVDAFVLGKNGYDTGLLKGCTITQGVGETFSVADGIFIYKEGDPADPFVEPIIHVVDFAAQADIAPTYLATHPATYIGISYIVGTQTSILVQASAPFTNANRRGITQLGVIHHGDNTTIGSISNEATPPVQVANQLHDLIWAVGGLNLSGNKFGPNGANLSMDKTGGVIFKQGISYSTTTSDPHRKTITAEFALTFRYRTQTSIESVDITTIEPDFWDNAGTATAMTTDYWSIQRVYLFGNGIVRMQYGQAEYATKDEAVSILASEDFIEEQSIAANGIHRAYLVVKEGATDLTNLAEAEFFEVAKYGWVVQSLQNIQSDAYYEHTQGAASTAWVIPHNLNKNPSVTVQDASGNDVEGDIVYTDLNNLTINFNTAFDGVAYLN